MNDCPSFAAASAADALACIDAWVEHGGVRELDRAFAAFIADPGDQADPAHPLLILAAALASHQLGRGHACLDLDAVLKDPREALSLPPERPSAAGLGATSVPCWPAALLAGIDLATWQQALRDPRRVGHGRGNTPLVLCADRLYLRRYWQHEQTVRQAIEQRLAPGAASQPDEPALRQALQALFPRAAAGAGIDWQRVACALAARHGFAIITGGPGTGKTTTVVKLLAVLQHLAMNAGTGARRLRIRMAAPTGKAAARLNEAVAGAVRQLPLAGLPNPDALRAAIPTEVTTVHRLLGSRPDSRHFRHGARNPLPVDVLVIDEASMVDLEMMASVLAALPVQAKLVLLGDKDQLASVEAGAVLGDLCRRADLDGYTAATRDWLQRVAGETVVAVAGAGLPLDQAIVKLRVSHRFDTDSGIGRLADAVNAGQMGKLREVLQQAPPDLARLDLVADSQALDRLALDGASGAFPGQGQGRIVHGQPAAAPVGYRHYLGLLRASRPRVGAGAEAWDDWARAVLAAHGQFQLLCAVRQGPHGVEGLNQRIADLLCREGLTTAAQGWYEGRPVMVTRNDYALGLMNGDVGITLEVPRRGGAEPAVTGGIPQTLLRVAFATGDGSNGIHWVLPSRLQAVETVFAMTVHKSQGSEFTHAALVLPDVASRVLTRELVYTGITRARHWFTLATSDAGRGVLDLVVGRQVERTGGMLG